MSARLVPRTALKQLRWSVQRRAESTTSQVASTASSTASSTAAKAKETASQAAGKAQQGLSRVTSSAGNAVSSAATSASEAASASTGRIGQAMNFVQSLYPPTMYYMRVAGELGRLMIQGRNMYPPTMQTINSYLTPVQNAIRNPSSLMSRTTSTATSAANTAQNAATEAASNPQSFLTRLRNFDTTTLQTAGVVTAEVVGFFCLGEMLGRLKIVGYWGAHGEHH
ncbi:hypothetical protein BAUCODRAFT_65355 [Baudoinia panamericana UAMH 10762]|uniref:Uncharacterized protein n=1 Tax=Baudoinia panamericana (strain UAMH 10762) TaxID=717646 RepID=M2N467_BAUPA|nr:uncharacterized protein BAUCODRAFT_65355 [Baudoinia panamericana UAMH 10762]EMC98783.1 hypothetical protein BAUCODRAFT_65355 [Baudoinia panamericana UAMH 10762]